MLKSNPGVKHTQRRGVGLPASSKFCFGSGWTAHTIRGFLCMAQLGMPRAESATPSTLYSPLFFPPLSPFGSTFHGSTLEIIQRLGSPEPAWLCGMGFPECTAKVCGRQRRSAHVNSWTACSDPRQRERIGGNQHPSSCLSPPSAQEILFPDIEQGQNNVFPI